MLSFRLLGYPIRVEWFFWVLCLLIGMPYLEKGGPDGVAAFLIVAAIVFVSIIWHELGHALARKRFGESYSEIVLHGFGGYCSGPGHFTRFESVIISAAGPAASLALGLTVWLISTTVPGSQWLLSVAVATLLWVNIGWAIFNLLPLYPLDGGQIFAALAGPRHFRKVLWVGIGIAVALGFTGYFLQGSLFSLILCGMLAWGNWQRLQGQQSSFP